MLDELKGRSKHHSQVGMFPVAGDSYWSHVKYILSLWCFLLVACEVYSQWLVLPIGRM
jgi:hypothetical protein